MQNISTIKNHIIVYVTAPSIEEGQKIDNILIEKKLAACISFIPKIISIYRWEEKIEESQEVLLMIKTHSNLFNEIVKIVKKLHSYTVPEIISVPIEQGSHDYLTWLNSELKNN